ncbi:hypothetical protein IJ843_02045 [bacterium]|nr:hypothetical protein [bacterium]
MKITQSATSPNFTAKLKNNELTEKYINRMNNDQLSDFNKALKKLDKTHPNDTVEMKVIGYIGKNKMKTPMFGFVNTNDESKKSPVSIDVFMTPNVLIDKVKELATKGSEMHNKVFGDNEKENLKTSIFSMLG